MGAYEDAAEARMAAAKAAAKAADIAEKARITAMGQASASSKPLTRAQQVTANRLATSPIAQEAARTTAALKSFTAKGGLLGVPGSNLQGAGASTGGNPRDVISSVDNGDGTETITYRNGTTEIVSTYNPRGGTAAAIATAEAAKLKLLADQEAARIAEEKRSAGQSAYDLLFEQFSRYGMGSLVEPLKQFIQQGISSSEFTLRLRDTDAYKKRFAANASRVAKGLSALNEAEYIGLEDQYQNIMRQYGLPASYYTRGDMGRQEGFEKFLANDVSAAELEDRVLTAQSRVINANPEVLASLKQFYPGISNGDILAYTLDPEKALTDIKRKVTAAEIGGSAMQAGLGISGTRAEELGAAGVTKQQAQQGFQTVAEVAPRGGQLAEIYKQSPYTQTTAEAEVFGLAGSAEAARQRKKLTSLETAAFSGSAGAGAIARDRAGVL
jgi:hypothetical protein